jgi:hypothetical protein
MSTPGDSPPKSFDSSLYPHPSSFNDSFRGFPVRLLEDETLSSNDIDIAMAVLALTSLRGSDDGWGTKKGKSIQLAPDVTTELLANFTRIDVKNIARHLGHLETSKYIVTETTERRITDLRWNMNTKGIRRALELKEAWVRVPKAILFDPSLPSTAKHAYLALCRLNYTLTSRDLRNRGHLRTDFPVSDGLLGDVMHKGRAAAARYKADLHALRLIERGEGKPLKGIPQIRFVPLEVRYAYSNRAQAHRARGVPLYVPLRDYEERWHSYASGNEISVTEYDYS